jgi:hypothetical protein
MSLVPPVYSINSVLPIYSTHSINAVRKDIKICTCKCTTLCISSYVCTVSNINADIAAAAKETPSILIRQ